MKKEANIENYKIVTNENGINAQRTSMDLPIIKSHSSSSSDNQ
jgi:hypothetical protein